MVNLVELTDLDRLPRSTIETTDGSTLMERFDVYVSSGYTVRLHHWLASDDDRAMHDHPWSNTTTVIAGHLREHTLDGAFDLRPGSVVTRAATDPHRIELVSGDAWTMFVVGKVHRRWGFHTDDGWVYWQAYERAPVEASRSW